MTLDALADHRDHLDAMLFGGLVGDKDDHPRYTSLISCITRETTTRVISCAPSAIADQQPTVATQQRFCRPRTPA